MRTVFADVTLAILAGGAGSRMGGPKGLLTIAGRPILETLLARLRWDGPTMLVTAPGREHPPGWQKFAREVVDPVANEGPLRGIVTALESSIAAKFIFLPVDMPLMRREMLCWMIERHNASNSLGTLAQRRINNVQQIEPMPIVLGAATLPILQRRLQNGQRSVGGLVSEIGFHIADVPAHFSERIWTNLNSAADMLQLASALDSDDLGLKAPAIASDGVVR